MVVEIAFAPDHVRKNPVIYSRALCKPVHDRRWNAVEVRQHLGPPTHRFCTHQQQKNSNWGKTDKPGIQSEMIVETFDFVVSVAETILFNINFKNRRSSRPQLTFPLHMWYGYFKTSVVTHVINASASVRLEVSG